MARLTESKRNLQSLEAVITVARLKESRLSQLLQRAELRLLEQKQLLDTLVAYGEEYREKISAMDHANHPLTTELLLLRQNLLAMINQVEGMKVTQLMQVSRVEAELRRIKESFQKAHLSLRNLEELQVKKKQTLQNEKIKHEEKRNYDEYLTRISSEASITGN